VVPRAAALISQQKAYRQSERALYEPTGTWVLKARCFSPASVLDVSLEGASEKKTLPLSSVEPSLFSFTF